MDDLIASALDAADLSDQIKPFVGILLAAQLSHMGAKSLFNLQTAIMAARMEGVGGTLRVKIPSKKNQRYEIEWETEPIAS